MRYHNQHKEILRAVQAISVIRFLSMNEFTLLLAIFICGNKTNYQK
jgi:hypothetical protein